MSKPVPNIFQRDVDVIEPSSSDANATFISGDKNTSDFAVSTITLPDAPDVEGDKHWLPKTLIDYVNSKISSRILYQNDTNPAIKVRGIQFWMNFLTWPKQQWDAAIIGVGILELNPFERTRKYNPYDANSQEWGQAFLGIRLPVSNAPLTWKDVLHIRNVLKSDEKGPLLRLREADGRAVTDPRVNKGGKKQKTRKEKRDRKGGNDDDTSKTLKHINVMKQRAITKFRAREPFEDTPAFEQRLVQAFKAEGLTEQQAQEAKRNYMILHSTPATAAQRMRTTMAARRSGGKRKTKKHKRSKKAGNPNDATKKPLTLEDRIKRGKRNFQQSIDYQTMKNEGRNHNDESLDVVKQYLKAEGLTESQAESAVISMPRSLNASYVTGGKRKTKKKK